MSPAPEGFARNVFQRRGCTSSTRCATAVLTAFPFRNAPERETLVDGLHVTPGLDLLVDKTHNPVAEFNAERSFAGAPVL